MTVLSPKRWWGSKGATVATTHRASMRLFPLMEPVSDLWTAARTSLFDHLVGGRNECSQNSRKNSVFSFSLITSLSLRGKLIRKVCFPYQWALTFQHKNVAYGSNDLLPARRPTKLLCPTFRFLEKNLAKCAHTERRMAKGREAIISELVAVAMAK